MTSTFPVSCTMINNSFKCDLCNNTGWIVGDVAKECICSDTRQYYRLLEKSGIAKAFLQHTFANFLERNIKALMQMKKNAIDYAHNFKTIFQKKHNSIAFLGQVGSGKTHLSIAIANELMRKGVGVLYMQYREAIIKIKQNILNDEFYQLEINRYKNAPVLLIDDLYKGKTTEADINIMFEIVNYRYLNNLPLVVSSELKINDIIKLDEAVGSRIVEMCKGRIAELSGRELNYRLLT